MEIDSASKTEVLNLRITVQKLTEEVNLWRNGTEGSDFIEMLEEKDTEIKELKEKLGMRDEKIRQLAKIAEQTVKENKALAEEKKLFDKQLHRAEMKGRAETTKGTTQKDEELKKLKEEIASLRADNDALTNSIDMLIPETEQFQDHIDSLETEQLNSMTDIERLQQRCVNVVIEMKQNKQELVDRANRAEKELAKAQSLNDRYHAEVLKAQSFNGDLKDKLASYKERITHLEKSVVVRKSRATDKKENTVSTKTSVPSKTSSPGRSKRVHAVPFKTAEPSSAFASGEVM
jgi:chromosome segregation ATPase